MIAQTTPVGLAATAVLLYGQLLCLPVASKWKLRWVSLFENGKRDGRDEERNTTERLETINSGRSFHGFYGFLL